MTDYKTLLQQKAELDTRIAAVLKTEKAAAVAEVRLLVQQYQLSQQDVFPSRGVKQKGSMGEPKYRDPATGATWTGRGKPPTWIVGKDRGQFLIEAAKG
ncbi:MULTISPECIES: H-NS histone family protein [Comamonadaceae]|jgi:DNA-binding protein H-NS|uniref:H-NS histone family protein n=1 Tax=Comamonadaceae TaxID=80864 RepID=UPI00034EB7E5|nr:MULTISPECIES: H-NS histone family protein [Comamonadaceae]EPD41148.1 DNA-binding protein H-NS [Delftia acidovorans CCUG 15835]KEH09669.1 histone [Delftia tsuruhatensis]MCX7505919.1 H-NS histone family protein [Delftia tsuruhatensis]MDH0422486.1 H-NS histone family protein [Delftia tsuruhatensis]MDR0212476.1 H-NS histone family protein [Comamonas sp.]